MRNLNFRYSRTLPAAVLLAGTLVVPLLSGSASAAQKHSVEPVTMSVFAEGLNNPRGLKFGPDGYLYVAEGGTGGSTPAPDDPECTVLPPVGPYLGSTDGSRILKFDPFGNRTTVVDGLPSSQTSAALGSLITGVADIAFVGNELYAVLGGAGCSHGVPTVPNSVIHVMPGNSWEIVADLGSFQRANPVAHPEEDDFEPDGTWYSMIALRGDLYAVEPNHGEIVKVTTDGAISRVIDISASQGHVVPTVITEHGNFYVGNLGVFPQDQGTSAIWKITPSGNIKKVADGFNMVLGIVFDQYDRIYVLQASAAPAPAPGTGSIVRLSPDRKEREVIATGLFLPTGMTIGPDGNLYVSNVGFGPPPIGLGQILKFDISHH